MKNGFIKRRILTLGLGAFTCLILTGALAFAVPNESIATVSKTNVNMRQQASTSAPVVAKLKKGAQLSVVATEGEWLLLRSGGTSGYVRADMLSVTSLNAPPQVEPQDGFIPLPIYDLTQLPDTQSDAIYGDVFDEIPDESELPPSSGEVVPDQSTQQLMGVQSSLQALGFYSGKIDGAFGAGSTSALKAFQRAYGLPVDGKYGAGTASAIQAAQSGGNGSSAAQVAVKDGVILSEWYNYMKTAIPKKENILCIDVKTGTQFYLRPFACGSHADVEPPTVQDTQTILAMNGGKWAWAARPIIAMIDGRAYAAAINVQPHGPDTLPDNGMEGQLCMHFLHSRQHNTGSESTDLQKAVLYAFNNGGKYVG